MFGIWLFPIASIAENFERHSYWWVIRFLPAAAIPCEHWVGGGKGRGYDVTHNGYIFQQLLWTLTSRCSL